VTLDAFARALPLRAEVLMTIAENECRPPVLSAMLHGFPLVACISVQVFWP
jgi:hypothetical protein